MTLLELIESRVVECCGLEYMRRDDGLIAPKRVDDQGEDFFDLSTSIELCVDCGQPIDPLIRAGVRMRPDQDDAEPAGGWW